MFSSIAQWNKELFMMINQVGSSTTLDQLMVALSSLNLGLLILCLTGALIVYWKRKKGLVLTFQLFLLIGITDLFCSRILKPQIQHARPCHVLETKLYKNKCGGKYGFPSNHAANAMAYGVFLAFLSRNHWFKSGIVLALLIGLSRIYLGNHFPFDVLFGFLVGGMLALLQNYFSNKFHLVRLAGT